MNKPLLIYQALVATRSGYGDHSRDILKSIFEYDKFDVITIPTRWGNTPQNQINPSNINLSSLSSGQYILKIESEGSIKYEKIFKI